MAYTPANHIGENGASTSSAPSLSSLTADASKAQIGPSDSNTKANVPAALSIPQITGSPSKELNSWFLLSVNTAGKVTASSQPNTPP